MRISLDELAEALGKIQVGVYQPLNGAITIGSVVNPRLVAIAVGAQVALTRG